MPDRRAAQKHVIEARQHLAALREILKEGEHGSFVGWYQGDRLFGIEGLDQSMTAVIEDLDRK